MAPIVDPLPTAASRFGGLLGRAASQAQRPEEERKECSMKIPDKESESSQLTPQFYKLPAQISEFSDDEIEALVTDIYDRFLADRGLAPCNSREFKN